jgi:hypothetical protein
MKSMHASQTPSTATPQLSPSGWLRNGLLGALLLAAPLGFADSGANHRVASPLLGTSGSSIEHILDKAFVYCYTDTLGARGVLPHVILLPTASPRMLPVTSSMRR